MKAENKHITDDLIPTFLMEGLQGKDLDELKAWIAESEENRSYFMQIQEIWFSTIEEKDLQHYNPKKAFALFKRKVAKRQRQKNTPTCLRFKSIYKYAAAMALLIGVSYYSYQSGTQNPDYDKTTEVKIETPIASQTQLLLSDGTKILLNSNSYITYGQDFGIKSREIFLQGEGYFEVAHNPQMPFNVKTANITVQVLGTKFNFRDYPEDEKAIVSLIEGKVSLKNQMTPEADITLAPHEEMVLKKGQKVMMKMEMNAQTALQWTKGQLVFDEEPLSEVVKVLNRNYGVKIEISDSNLEKLKVFGSFDKSSQSIYDILNSLAATEKIKYRTCENTIDIY